MDKVSFFLLDDTRAKPFRAFVTCILKRNAVTVSLEAAIGDDPFPDEIFRDRYTFEDKVDFKEFKAFRAFLKKEFDNKFTEEDLIKALNKKFSEASKGKIGIMELATQFREMNLFGPAGGADLYIGNSVFRMKNDDFLTPKNFMIWYASIFRRTLTLDEVEWRALLDAWLPNAVMLDSSDDSLAPPVMEELITRILKNRIVKTMSEEDVLNVIKGGATVFWLKNDQILHVPTKVYQSIGDKLGVTSRKMRQFVEKHLIEKKSLQTKLHGEVVRFWHFDWDKLCISFPQLKDIQIEMEVEVEDAEDFADIYCSDCGQFFDSELYLEHVADPNGQLAAKPSIPKIPVKQTDLQGQTVKPEPKKEASYKPKNNGNGPSEEEVLKSLIDCTHNSTKKYRGVSELMTMLPLGTDWEPSVVFQALQSLEKKGLVRKMKGGLKFGAVVVVGAQEEVESK